MAKKEKKPKFYDIKIPVYTTEIFEKANDMFGGISLEHMNTYITKKIKNYSNNQYLLSFENRNKTKRTVIKEIKTHKNDSDPNALLIQVTAYSTNLYDGYLEAEEKIKFKKNHKLGSETNFIMIYPVIKGIDINSYSHHFLVLVYEDPTKANDEILKITKNILNKIFETPIANIKLPTILEEIKQYKSIPELQMKYSSIDYNENDVDIEFRDYLVDGKLQKSKFHNFKNMPTSKIEKIIDKPTEEDYQKKEIKLIVGKKEYKIIKEMINEASDELKQTAEKVFNMKTSVSEEEMENLHNVDFIFSKLIPVLGNYLSNGE